MKKFLAHFLVLLALLSTGGLIVHAQTPAGGTSNTGGSTIPNPFNCGGAADSSGGCTLNVFLLSILHNIVLPLGGILAVLAFIWVGFMFVTARGNPAKIETARTALLYVAIGTAVLLGAEIIAAVIQNTANQL